MKVSVIRKAVWVLTLSLAWNAWGKAAPASEKGRYLVTEKVAKLFDFMPDVHPQILGSSNGQTLVALTLDEVEKLAEKIHQTFHSCGGFFEVNDAWEKAGSVEKFFTARAAEAAQNLVSTQFEPNEIRYADSARAVIERVQEERFENTLNQFTQFPDRSARSENGRKAAEWLRDEALRYAQTMGRNDVSARMIKTGSRYTQDSVVVKIAGKTDQAGVLVGGHMDTFNNNKPGADDDGSGTISALEIYKAILDSGLKFQRPIYIAFYAAEELGLVGSSQVAQTFRQEGVALRSVLQFDMTGYRSPQETKDIYFIEDNVSAEATSFAEKVAREILEIPADKIGRTRCNYGCSDHASWDRQGYAAVFPFESSFNNHNRTIHSSSDTISQMSIPHAMKFVRLGTAFVVEVAEPIR